MIKFILEIIVILAICLSGSYLGIGQLSNYPSLCFIVGGLTGGLATISLFIMEQI